jgi:hypothetical protein
MAELLVTNAQTPHSRALRAATATARNRRLLADGYRRLNILISPEAHQALERLAQDAGSKTAVIEKLLNP